MIIGFELDKLAKTTYIGQTICPSDWCLHPRVLPEYEYVFCYQGNATFYLEKQAYALKPGDILLIPPNQSHFAETDPSDPGRFYYVHFIPGSQASLFTESQITDQIIGSQNNNERYFISLDNMFIKIYIPLHMALDSYRDEIYTLFERALIERNKRTFNSDLLITLYINQIMALLSRLVVTNIKHNIQTDISGKTPRLLQEIVYYINEHITGNLRVNEISSCFKVSPQHVIGLFKKEMGITPLNYINELKISKAKDLIRDTPLTLKEVCYAVGLENPHYFSRLFKKVEGISPSEFRKGFDTKSNI